jgi:hypothetical protein
MSATEKSGLSEVAGKRANDAASCANRTGHTMIIFSSSKPVGAEALAAHGMWPYP